MKSLAAFFNEKLKVGGSTDTDTRMFTQDAKPPIELEKLSLPKVFKNKLAFVLHNVLTEQECQNFIALSEKKGYDAALIGQSQRLVTEVRNSQRCIIDSVEYTDEMWKRIKEFIPATFGGRKVLGLNERLRFLRYDPGEYFKPHLDGIYMRDNGERSCITFQLYLNEGFEGGATTFIGAGEEDIVPVIPKTGSVLIFQHDILHEGSKLIKGRKYTVRTDIMYSSQREEES